MEFIAFEVVRVNTKAEYDDVVLRYGYCVSVFVAASRAGVDRSRIYQLLDDGTFRKFFIFGQVHIANGELVDWQRKRGAE